MPYAFETHKNKLPKGKDRRRKLTEKDKIEIMRLTDEGHSQRELARMFGVSRRTIQFVQDPEKLKQNKARRKERGGWRQYYDKSDHRKSMKEHREYKKKVLKDS